jgi:hypothetical protein
MTVCPLCNREVESGDVYPVHYNSGLLRCPNSGEPTSEKSEPVAEKKPVKRAPRKKAT